MNSIQTWQQGHFRDGPRYQHWPRKDKVFAERQESRKVRPGPKENVICKASSPENAKWIASRLNLASVLEQLTYDYATGKTDGSEIVKVVMENVS